MYRIIGYISDLLYIHDCVIVPDFGAFIANYQTAIIDEKNKCITPPSKFVVFNKNITHNDGLLIDWIASSENIDFKKAQIKLNLFVEELKVKLNKRERIEFGELGTFFVDKKYQILFDAKKKNYCADTIGMEKMTLSKPKETKKEQPAPEEQKSTAVPCPINEPKIQFAQRIFRLSFMILLIVIGAITIYVYYIEPKAEEITQTKITTMSIQPPVKQVSELLNNAFSSTTYTISSDDEYVEYDPALDLNN